METGTVTRRGLLIAAGVATLSATAPEEGSAAPPEKPKGERAYEGASHDGKLEEALATALRQLDKDLPEGGVADASAVWKLAEVAGQRGGIAGLHTLRVRIVAVRTPPWNS